jgi:hypothetical protein
MSQVQRRFPHAKHQRTTLFQHHIRCTRHQRVGIAVYNAGKGFNRTGQNNHAGRFKRARRDAGGDIAGIVDNVRQGLNVAQREIGFKREGLTRRLAHHQMGFYACNVTQHL